MRPKRKTSCSTRRTSDFHDDDGLGEDFDVNDDLADGDDDDDVPDCNLIFSPGNFSTLFFLQTTEYFIENQEN